MGNNKSAVQRWREATKERIVKAMGGRCVCCGYLRCTRALALHHLIPGEKEFALSKLTSSPKSWDRIVKELRKCIMVCHNCHSEIHEGSLAIPDIVSSFNEEFVVYQVPKGEVLDTCPICQGPKPIHYLTCSRECARKKQMIVDWDQYDLLEMAKSMNISQIASTIGLSHPAVKKRLKKLGILEEFLDIRSSQR